TDRHTHTDRQTDTHYSRIHTHMHYSRTHTHTHASTTVEHTHTQRQIHKQIHTQTHTITHTQQSTSVCPLLHHPHTNTHTGDGDKSDQVSLQPEMQRYRSRVTFY